MSLLRLTVSAISTIALSSWALPIQAKQPQTITLSSKVTPQYVRGEQIGCQLGFEVARNDPEYSGGKLVYLTGNLGFKAFEGKELAFTFKLGATSLEARGTFTPPAEVYLLDGYQSNVSEFVTSMEGETGFRLFVYSAGNATLNAALKSAIQDQKFTFSYAMTPGGLNAIVPVDLRVEELDLENPKNSIISDKNSKEWASCMKEALDAAKARLTSSN